MKLSTATTLRLAAIGSLLISVGAFVVGALPKGTVSDKLLYASLFVRLFAAELVPLALLAVLLGTGYVVYPSWAASAPVRWLQTARDARRMRFFVCLSLTCAGLIVAAFVVSAALAWARYTFIYLREDLLNSHLRRLVLLEARRDEARGDLPSAVLKLQRFARMFPERAEANDIANDVQRLEAVMAHSQELSELADRLEQSSGTSEAVVELRSMALADWPAQPGSRDKLERSVTRWGLALGAYFAFRSNCEDTVALEPRQVALSLVVQGYRHPQDFPGASDLADAGKPLCALVRGLAAQRQATFKIHERAQGLLASTSQDKLALRAQAWEEQAWTHDTDRYHSKRMQAVVQGLWYRLAWGTSHPGLVEDGNDEEAASLEESPGLPFLRPARMLDTKAPAGTRRNNDGEWPIKVIPGQRGDILLCWSKPTGLPDVSLSGPASASVVTLSPNCVGAERQFAPLHLRTAEMQQHVVDLVSTAAERVAQQARPADRQALRSLCFMVARVSALGAVASDSANALCKLEIMVDQLGRRP